MVGPADPVSHWAHCDSQASFSAHRPWGEGRNLHFAFSKLKCPLERMMVPGVCRWEDTAARIFDVQLAFLVHVTPSHIINTQQGEPHCCPTRWPLAIGATSILMKENRIKLNIGFLMGYIPSAGHYK